MNQPIKHPHTMTADDHGVLHQAIKATLPAADVDSAEISRLIDKGWLECFRAGNDWRLRVTHAGRVAMASHGRPGA